MTLLPGPKHILFKFSACSKVATSSNTIKLFSHASFRMKIGVSMSSASGLSSNNVVKSLLRTTLSPRLVDSSLTFSMKQ
ncbi:disease resistance protein RPV1 [Trifolium repens]|nr:disease resistance protein RPV1 [Trifolium repens]